MSTLLIGAKWDGHDSAVFLADPARGSVVGLGTERVTRLKHDRVFPLPALDRALETGLVDPNPARVVFRDAFSSDETITYRARHYDTELAWRSMLGAETAKGLEQQLDTFRSRPRAMRFTRLVLDRHGRSVLTNTLFARGRHGIFARSVIVDALRQRFPSSSIDVGFVDHEFCHALCAAAVAPPGDLLVVAMDGSGDNNDFTAAFVNDPDGALTEIARSAGTRRVGIGRLRLSKICSPGGVYSLITQLLGFRMDSDEGKTEALAAYGNPVESVLDALREATSLDLDALSLTLDPDGVERALEVLSDPRLSAPAIAATAQCYLEAAVLPYMRALVDATGRRRIAVAGGVFANVVLNLRLFESVASELHVAPAMGDDGSAQGACVAAALAEGLSPAEAYRLVGAPMPFHGPALSSADVQVAVERVNGVRAQRLPEDWHGFVAHALNAGKSVAMARGRMEWGPRALGNRSVLVSAAHPDARDRVNELKGRPSFQPVCPVVLREDAERLFHRSYANPHMTCAFRVREAVSAALPAMAHVDGTARAQIIDVTDHPDLFCVVSALRRLDGWGVVLNTSFNRHGRTMVMTPEHALRDFIDMRLDAMVLGDLWVEPL
ncbi:MAG: carbamoyltransferase C-terminal domain-containing protein [Solirubrobacteraceae bacterium]